MPETTTTNESPDSATTNDLTALRERIASLEQQNGEFLRHLAEFQNRNNELLQVMKRKEQDLDQRLKYVHEKLALDLVTALDNLDRAIEAANKVGEQGPLAQGVLATQCKSWRH